MKKNVFGIKVDDISIQEIVETAKVWLSKPGQYYIVTPNPEIVVMAQDDLELKNIINNADLAIPDGAGLKLSGDIENTSPGVDVMERLIDMAAEKGFTTGFLGGRADVAAKTAECLRKKYPKLKVTFVSSGGEINKDGTNIILRDSSLIAQNDIPKTDILFVAFGPPKQENWIANNLAKLDVKVAMTVGGAFDVLSGRIPRAPKLMRSLNLEWLFRLIIQPWRIKRQLALLKFLLLVMLK